VQQLFYRAATGTQKKKVNLCPVVDGSHTEQLCVLQHWVMYLLDHCVKLEMCINRVAYRTGQ